MRRSRRERRNSERRTSALYLQFINHKTGQWVGDLADISAAGFRLESTHPIPLWTMFAFRVDVPREICDRPFIRLYARSLWGRRDPLDTRLYDTGFEIVSIDPGDMRVVERIIEQYGQRALEEPSRTRYSLDA